ncbi:hypothetical protein KY340_01390 [Candidatus Woesearchaeota archaeon]|nr:hypothetical protein [Candidatus Woesearchaeota archaeon]
MGMGGGTGCGTSNERFEEVIYFYRLKRLSPTSIQRREGFFIPADSLILYREMAYRSNLEDGRYVLSRDPEWISEINEALKDPEAHRLTYHELLRFQFREDKLAEILKNVRLEIAARDETDKGIQELLNIAKDVE